MPSRAPGKQKVLFVPIIRHRFPSTNLHNRLVSGLHVEER